MKPIAEFNEESNKKDLKFKINYYVRISKFRNIFAKRYCPNWSEETFLLKKKKILYHGHMKLMI